MVPFNFTIKNICQMLLPHYAAKGFEVPLCNLDPFITCNGTRYKVKLQLMFFE